MLQITEGVMTDPDWQPMDTAKQDGSMMNLFCPGVSDPTKGVLQGCWNARLGVWILNPYGSTQFTTLFPSRWCPIEAPPA